jgi:photosystem II stability/assembly factor-like uncharacterized protein
MRIPAQPILTFCACWAIALGQAAGSSITTVVEPPIQEIYSLDGEHRWGLIRNPAGKEFLFSTADGGQHWTASPLPFRVWRVFFADASEGWGIAAERSGEAWRTFCIHTADAGRTWRRLGPIAQDEATPTGIAFDSPQHGWVVGEGKEEGASGIAVVMETDDGGLHWTRRKWKTEPASGLGGVRCCDGHALTWSSGAGGPGVYELRSGGQPGQVFDGETMDLACFADGAALAVSMGGAYRGRLDAPDWEETLSASPAVLRTLALIDAQRACAAGEEMYCTQDGGRSWSSRPLPKAGRYDTVHVFGLWKVDEDLLWAASEDTIYQVTADGRRWTKLHLFDQSGRPLVPVPGR